MGRPLAKSNFGNTAGKIAVRVHNGTAVVNGFIIRQLGARRFVIGCFAGAAGDSAGAPLQLIRTLRTTSGAPVAGQCIITATPFGGSSTNVRSLMMAKLVLVTGAVVIYRRAVAANAAGKATLAVLAGAVTNVNDA